MKNLLYFINAAILFGCADSEAIQPYLGQEYVNLDPSFYRIYEVTYIEYNAAIPEPDTSRYFIRESTVDTLSFSGDEVSYTLMRERSADMNQWEEDSIWLVTLSRSAFHVQEGDITYQKLAFPVRYNTTWDGNAFNTSRSLPYSYEDLHMPYTRQNITIDSTLRVVQADLIDPLEITATDSRYEIYGKDVGLLEKIVDQVTFCGSLDCAGEVVFGQRYSAYLIEFGYE